jgi:AcrR family transcriptional regulator/predicted transcriptional regulator
MKMSELSARAKIPATTISYYIRQALLPEPIRTGKTMAYYTVEHMERLKQIQALQDKGLSLDEISRVVNQNSAEINSNLNPDGVYTSKRNEIVKAAVNLFRDKGYDNTNIDDIVAYAGIGKSTFYQYFKSKEELFYECADNVFYDIARDNSTISNEQNGLMRLWKRAVSFMHTHLHMLDMLNIARGASMKNSLRSQQMLESVMNNLTDPIKADLILASNQGTIHFKDLHVLAYLIIGAGEYGYYYSQIHPESNIESVLMRGWDIFFNSISQSTGQKGRSLINSTTVSCGISKPSTENGLFASGREESALSNMKENDLMKISELSRRSKIPLSTIRYYILEGLLPPAIKTGKTRAYYSNIHLKVLNLIRHKQVEENKPLSVIKEEIKKDNYFSGNSSTKPSDLSSDKRDAILASSITLFLDKGYAETSTSDIAHHAKISKGTIYQNFSNKEDIFMACADRIFHDMYNDVWNEIKEEKDMVLRMIKRAKAFFSSYPQWISMMNLVKSLAVGDKPSFRTKFHQLIQQMVNPMVREIELLQQEGRIRKDIDCDLAGYILMGIAEYSAWLVIHENYSEETLMEYLISIFAQNVSLHKL